MAGYNYAQNIIGLKKGSGDIHELEVEVANLSASVLTIGEKLENVTKASTTERVVGKWIDGSNLYEKTIHIPALPNNDTAEINHNITNILKIVGIFGYGLRIGQTITFNIPYTVPLGDKSMGYVTANVNNTNISVTTNYDARNYEAYFTLRYTKTAS